MEVNFKRNGKTYVGFVVGSPEWEALDFSEQEKSEISVLSPVSVCVPGAAERIKVTTKL